MQSKIPFMAIALVAVALSGCASDPPAGELNGGSMAFAPSGTASMDAHAATNPYATGLPIDDVVECIPDVITGNVPQLPSCGAAYTWINVTNVELPEVDGYMLYLNGSAGEKHVGALQGAEGLYSLSSQFVGEDFSGQYNEAQVRLGDLTIASAGLPTGNFVVSNNLVGSSIDATFSGKKLEYTVSGLDASGSYEAWLVGEDESGALAHMDKWTITNGAGQFEAEMNIADYSEFHIHVGGSSINVLKLTIA